MTTTKRRGIQPPSRSGWPERLAYLREVPNEWDMVKECNTVGSAKTIAGRIRRYLGSEFEVTVRGEEIYARFYETPEGDEQ